MIFEKNFLGRAGFYWFFGTVESRLDPLQNNRVQVRCKGYHTGDTQILKTNQLIWSNVMMSPSSAGVSGIGETHKLVEGSWVWGYFVDGMECQEAVVVGTWAGLPLSVANSTQGFNDQRTVFTNTPQKVTSFSYTSSGPTISNAPVGPFPRADRLNEPDVSRLARNNPSYQPTQVAQITASLAFAGTTVSTTTSSWTVPNWYAAVYPYNWVRESESGHVFELDDSPGAERVNLFHRTGSFLQMGPDGSMIINATKNRYDLIAATSYEHTLGSKFVTVEGSYGLLVKGGTSSLIITVNGSGGLTINCGSGPVNITGTSISLTGNTTITGTLHVTGNVQMDSNLNVNGSIT